MSARADVRPNRLPGAVRPADRPGTRTGAHEIRGEMSARADVRPNRLQVRRTFGGSVRPVQGVGWTLAFARRYGLEGATANRSGDCPDIRTTVPCPRIRECGPGVCARVTRAADEALRRAERVEGRVEDRRTRTTGCVRPPMSRSPGGALAASAASGQSEAGRGVATTGVLLDLNSSTRRRVGTRRPLASGGWAGERGTTRSAYRPTGAESRRTMRRVRPTAPRRLVELRGVEPLTS